MLFNGTEALGRMAMEWMQGGLSNRPLLEPGWDRTEAATKSKSESVVSRRFVTATEMVLTDVLAEKRRQVVVARMQRAYHAEAAIVTEVQLSAPAAESRSQPPGRAAVRSLPPFSSRSPSRSLRTTCSGMCR